VNPTELLSIFTTIASAWTDPDGGINYQFLVGKKLQVSPLESTLTPLRGRPSAKVVTRPSRPPRSSFSTGVYTHLNLRFLDQTASYDVAGSVHYYPLALHRRPPACKPPMLELNGIP